MPFGEIAYKVKGWYDANIQQEPNLNTVGTITSGTWNGTILTVPFGGTARATATAFAPLCGGTTSTAAHQSTASGSTGQVLQSNGNASLPTFSTPTYPSASGTSRKILVSDGTNNIYSTETYAVPGSANNVMTSDGTNWTSAAPGGGGLVTVTGTLSNSQIKALHATPVQILAAQGAGTVIIVVYATLKLNYGGTNVFTAAAAQTITLAYGTTTSSTVMSATAITQAASQLFYQSPSQGPSGTNLYSGATNAALNWYNTSATEIAGNAANNNTMPWSVTYLVVTI